MIVRVRHVTHYRYAEPVSTSHHDARVAPLATELQRPLAHVVEVRPAPTSRAERTDFFGNRALHFELREPHDELEVTATSVVALTPASPPLALATPPWEAVRDRLRTDRRRDLLDAYAFTFPSPLVRPSAALAEYARPSFPQGRPVLAAVRDLTSRIHADFTYDPEATDVSTPVDEVLAHRRGVCQDFAHLEIACLRAMGLPARYVSGYLLTRPPPGKPKLVGADASHAWVATFVPDWGWVELDPTNDLIPSDEHVRVAFGRDFGDVTPIRGVILGGGAHEIDVAVDVSPVADAAEA
jgi:transglutaminase-like putative cysteine protease